MIARAVGGSLELPGSMYLGLSRLPPLISFEATFWNHHVCLARQVDSNEPGSADLSHLFGDFLEDRS